MIKYNTVWRGFGNGVETTYSPPALPDNISDIEVYIDDTKTVDWNWVDGKIEFFVAPPEGSVVAIYRVTDPLQLPEFTPNTPITAGTLNSLREITKKSLEEAYDGAMDSIEYYIDSKALKEAAEISAANAANSESNAAQSAANAATSEANAATSENNASVSESHAATSEYNASLSATSAANSASSAANSAQDSREYSELSGNYYNLIEGVSKQITLGEPYVDAGFLDDIFVDNIYDGRYAPVVTLDGTIDGGATATESYTETIECGGAFNG